MVPPFTLINRPGRGEQGVLTVRPYKDEFLPHWAFKTPSFSCTSSPKLYSIFESYRDQGDFIGCDLARKFIQMGHTRSRRYANYKVGRKYVDPETKDKQLPREKDKEKAESACMFNKVLLRVKEDQVYKRLKEEFIKL